MACIFGTREVRLGSLARSLNEKIEGWGHLAKMPPSSAFVLPTTVLILSARVSLTAEGSNWATWRPTRYILVWAMNPLPISCMWDSNGPHSRNIDPRYANEVFNPDLKSGGWNFWATKYHCLLRDNRSLIGGPKRGRNLGTLAFLQHEWSVRGC